MSSFPGFHNLLVSLSTRRMATLHFWRMCALEGNLCPPKAYKVERSNISPYHIQQTHDRLCQASTLYPINRDYYLEPKAVLAKAIQKFVITNFKKKLIGPKWASVTCSSPVCQQNFSGKVQSSVQLSIMVHVPFYAELTIFQLLYFESDRIVQMWGHVLVLALYIPPVLIYGKLINQLCWTDTKKTQKYMVTRSVK